jgi:hypothetical protein
MGTDIKLIRAAVEELLFAILEIRRELKPKNTEIIDGCLERCSDYLAKIERGNS